MSGLGSFSQRPAGHNFDQVPFRLRWHNVIEKQCIVARRFDPSHNPPSTLSIFLLNPYSRSSHIAPLLEPRASFRTGKNSKLKTRLDSIHDQVLLVLSHR